jgi:hypothetical protein
MGIPGTCRAKCRIDTTTPTTYASVYARQGRRNPVRVWSDEQDADEREHRVEAGDEDLNGER